MPIVILDSKELRDLARDMKHSDIRMVVRARKAMKKVDFALEKRIKQDMPVLTGRARSSWGHGSGESIYNVEDGGLTITQGSNVPYIEVLNAGHSKQAPAGFIDAAHKDAEAALTDELGFIDILRHVEGD